MSEFPSASLPEVFRTDDLIAYKAYDDLYILQTRKFCPVSIFLLIGQSKALVIDAGAEISDLTSSLKRLTDKPLELVITHGHVDHIGSINEFDHLYIHPGDRPLIPAYSGKVIEIRGGYQFDLGGRVLEVIELVGHTAGSVGLLDTTKRLLFTGDAIGSGLVWMHITKLPLEALLDAIQHVKAVQDRFDGIYVGHFTDVNKVLTMEYVNDLEALVRGIVRGTIPLPTEVDEVAKAQFKLPFDPLVARSGSAAVIFNPKRLHYV
jgi:glyoxylase-like metal-dependent hydrolase (beta-lactamase superfamily II)